MVVMRILVLLAIVYFNACILADADIVPIKNVLTNFSAKKFMVFIAVSDANRDGLFTIEDFHLIGDCLIDKNHQDEIKRKRMHDQDVPKLWKTMGFDDAAMGIPLTADKLLAFLVTGKSTPGFKEVVRSAYPIVFDVLRSYTSNKTISFEEFLVFQTCLQVDLDVTRTSFDMMDTDGDGGISLEEFLDGVVDFFTGEDENGPGTLIIGKID